MFWVVIAFSPEYTFELDFDPCFRHSIFTRDDVQPLYALILFLTVDMEAVGVAGTAQDDGEVFDLFSCIVICDGRASFGFQCLILLVMRIEAMVNDLSHGIDIVEDIMVPPTELENQQPNRLHRQLLFRPLSSK